MDRRDFIKSAGALALMAPVLVKEALAAGNQPLVAVPKGPTIRL